MSINDHVQVEQALDLARDYFHSGNLKDAERVCREILRADSHHTGALHRLAEVNLAVGIPGIAAAFSRSALALQPDGSAFHRTLGEALRGLGKFEAAEGSLRRAIELSPEDASNHASLGLALIDHGRLAEALDAIQRAVQCAPERGKTYIALGLVYLLMGRAEEAVASFRRAAELDPSNPNFEAGVLFSQHYLANVDPETLYADAKRWGTRFADPLSNAAPAHTNDADPNRRLRIGYVSGDFQQHPVARVLQAVLPAHDPAEVEVFCYATKRCLDRFARNLRLATDHWRSLVELSDEAAADLIRGDGIDILVDLSGHTGHNRLLTLARKPAPIQAIWLGYFDTTGMTGIDYIFADGFVCPPGDERFYVEDVIRLPHSFLCYSPTDASPEVNSLPMLSRGFVTFGSLNNIAKIGPHVMALWARILRAVPNARMVLKYGGLADENVRQDFLTRFAQHGIDSDRVTLLGSSPLGEHLTAYDEIDIALDPFPYNGGVTTLDALWMGTPVLSIRGDRFVGRMGASSLSTLGLQELIAETPDDYVAKAVSLAANPAHLIELRRSLRQRLIESPVCDGAAFARALEQNYRAMWRTWCRSRLEKAA